MKFKMIDDVALFLDNNISDAYLSKFSEFLLSGAIFTDASKVLSILIIVITVMETFLVTLIILFNLSFSSVNFFLCSLIYHFPC